MLPPYDSIATLTALDALVRATDATEVWCLGDSIHDSAGCDRLPAAARALLTAMTARTRWTWIAGNHDRAIADRCGGAVTDGVVGSGGGSGSSGGGSAGGGGGSGGGSGGGVGKGRPYDGCVDCWFSRRAFKAEREGKGGE